MTVHIDLEQRQRNWINVAHLAGYGGVEIIPLTSDASFRRYARLVPDTGPSVLLMDAPAPQEDLKAYLDVAGFLRQMGLNVPQIYYADLEQGYAVIEDFGDATFTRLLQSGQSEADLYMMAAQVLRFLHRQNEAIEAPVGQYTVDAYLHEVALFADWFVPAARGERLGPDDRDAYMAAWRAVLAGDMEQPQTLVLRDFHVDNLMLLSDGAEMQKCGLLDFQDALIGPCAYDLVSLLEDARRDVSVSVREAVMAYYTQGLNTASIDYLKTQMAILGAQRHSKVLGIFVRLFKRDGKATYLEHLPRVQKLLDRAYQHPLLADVAYATDQICPGWDHIDLSHPNRFLENC